MFYTIHSPVTFSQLCTKDCHRKTEDQIPQVLEGRTWEPDPPYQRRGPLSPHLQNQYRVRS